MLLTYNCGILCGVCSELHNYVINHILYVIGNINFIYSKRFYFFMTTVEEHESIVNELIDDINEKIRANLVISRQKIIGFSTSEASTNLFAILLHKKSLISPGFNVNHRFFASIKRAHDTFDFEFSNKTKILDLLVKQEQYRDKLCYGKDKTREVVDAAINNLFMLKDLIDSLLGDEN